MNKDFKKATFKDGDFSIDINISLEEETIWMTQKEIASVFGVTIGTINTSLKKTKNSDSTFQFYQIVQQENGRNVTRNVKIYNLEIITLLSYKVRSKRAPTFISWSNKTIEELKVKQEREINDSYDNVLHSNKNEIVKFKDGNFEMDVNVSPKEETIWLTQIDIAKLFESTVKNISVHINNIFDSGELDFSTMKENYIVQSEGGRNVKRKVTFYNLDMVISVGYRVNSKRGIIFRRWASSVIKNYLIEQYRYLDCKTLIMDVLTKNGDELDNVGRIVQILLEDYLNRDSVFIEQGESKKAFQFLLDIFASVKKEILIVDPYIDRTVLYFSSYCKEDVFFKIITSQNPSTNEDDINAIYANLFNKEIYFDNSIHDRYILVDNEKMYVLGASIKDISKKSTSILRVYAPSLINDFKKAINKIIEKHIDK